MGKRRNGRDGQRIYRHRLRGRCRTSVAARYRHRIDSGRRGRYRQDRRGRSAPAIAQSPARRQHHRASSTDNPVIGLQAGVLGHGDSSRWQSFYRNCTRGAYRTAAPGQRNMVAEYPRYHRRTANRNRIGRPECRNPCRKSARRTDPRGPRRRVCNRCQRRINAQGRTRRGRAHRVLRRNADRTYRCRAAAPTRQGNTIGKRAALCRRSADPHRIGRP